MVIADSLENLYNVAAMAIEHGHSPNQPHSLALSPQEKMTILGLLEALQLPITSEDGAYLAKQTILDALVAQIDGQHLGIREAFDQAFVKRTTGDDQPGKHDTLARWSPPFEVKMQLPFDSPHIKLHPGRGFTYTTIVFFDPNRTPGDNLIHDVFEGVTYDPTTHDPRQSYLLRLAHHTSDESNSTEPQTLMGPRSTGVLYVESQTRVIIMSTQNVDRNQFIVETPSHPHPEQN